MIQTSLTPPPQLSIAVEVTVSPKDEEQTHAMVDGMQYCKMFAADNLHPPHEVGQN